MLAYNVETVPCFVFLEPGGEQLQQHPTAVSRPGCGTAAKAPQLLAAAYIEPNSRTQQPLTHMTARCAGKALCKTPPPRSRQQMEAALQEMAQHAELGRRKAGKRAG
jgi:hypothetical protein